MNGPEHTAEKDTGGTAALCKDGICANGWHCTGSAHVGSILIRCTDPSHDMSPTFVVTPPRPTFTELLNDPTQQLDTEGVVLQEVLNERERDRLRSEGWRACVDHLQREYQRVADREPGKVPVVMLDGEQLWFLANVQNPFRPRVTSSDRTQVDS